MGITAGVAAAASIANAGYSIYQATRKPKAPVSAVIPPTPSAASDMASADVGSQAARAAMRKKAAQGKGRQSTILTSPQGLNSPAPGRTTLLGM